MNKVAIVAPCHIQPSVEWVNALLREQMDSSVDVIVVDDSNGKIDLPFTMYGYDAQKKELGEKLYKMFQRFHKSSACKNFGTWLAWKRGYETIIVIDSDCIVPIGFVERHLEALEQTWDGWGNPLTGTGMYSRGFPYSKRNIEVVANMGLWTRELDLYGKDRVEHDGKLPTEPCVHLKMNTVGTSEHFPLSGMNVAFKAKYVPYMLFLPNFSSGSEKFTRHDDIWGGYIFQKIVHQKGKLLSVGAPCVVHDTVVDAVQDAKDEEAMIKYEDAFYARVDGALVFTGTGCSSLSSQAIFDWLALEFGADETFSELGDALKFWALACK